MTDQMITQEWARTVQWVKECLALKEACHAEKKPTRPVNPKDLARRQAEEKESLARMLELQRDRSDPMVGARVTKRFYHSAEIEGVTIDTVSMMKRSITRMLGASTLKDFKKDWTVEYRSGFWQEY